MTDLTYETARPGRPRDPEVDRRIIDAVFEVYGEGGWEGFTLDRVAKRAGVGKSALYRRWNNKAELLADATLMLGDVAAIDTGTFRGDLLILAQQLVDRYFGPRGRAFVRLGLDSKTLPESAQKYLETSNAQVLAGRAMVRRAIVRGEIPQNSSQTLTIEMLHGTIMSHFLTTPPALMERARAKLPEFVEDLVNAVMKTLEPSSPP